MAVAPINYSHPAALSAFDFSPLSRLGQTFAPPPDQRLANLAERYQPASPTYARSTAPTSGGTDQYGRAIANIESGGRYDLMGPVTKSGDRAHGKYQIMGANIPVWSKAALGRALSPEEFLADPDAQEAVFKHRFGQYVEKYGPEGAAKAWFAGEGGMNNPNARDQLGTSVSDYARRFNAGLEGQ